MRAEKKIRNSYFPKWFLIKLSVALLITSSLIIVPAACKKEQEEVVKEVVRPVKLMTIGSGGAAFKRTFTGKVRASQRVDLAFQVSGPLIELPVEEGQRVEKDQLIARILPRDFETELEKAKARAIETEQNFQRYKNLYAKRLVAKAEYDKYKSQRDIARARQDEAQHALEDTYMRTPFAGVIAKRYVENFEEVKAKQAIVSLQDLTNVEILVDVPEGVMARMKKGATREKVAEFASAPGKKYPLKLKEFSTEADPRTQTYRVTLEMPAPEDINVLPGMTANVTVYQTGETGEDSGIVIPAIAVFADEAGDAHVWVTDQETMKVHRRKVTTGDLVGSDNIQILDGLNAGEMIAITGVSRLREDMQVRPMPDAY